MLSDPDPTLKVVSLVPSVFILTNLGEDDPE